MWTAHRGEDAIERSVWVDDVEELVFPKFEIPRISKTLSIPFRIALDSPELLERAHSEAQSESFGVETQWRVRRYRCELQPYSRKIRFTD
jgi:hypothetical protein